MRLHVRDTADDRPGIYRMLSSDGEVVYVGKSKKLRTRLLSYFRCAYPEEKGARILREAESILVNEGVPIAPLYFFSGFNYHNGDRITGIHGNILDIHPLNAIRKQSPKAQGQSSRSLTDQASRNAPKVLPASAPGLPLPD